VELICIYYLFIRGNNSDRDDDARSEGGKSVTSEGGLKKRGYIHSLDSSYFGHQLINIDHT